MRVAQIRYNAKYLFIPDYIFCVINRISWQKRRN